MKELSSWTLNPVFLGKPVVKHNGRYSRTTLNLQIQSDGLPSPTLAAQDHHRAPNSTVREEEIAAQGCSGGLHRRWPEIKGGEDVENFIEDFFLHGIEIEQKSFSSFAHKQEIIIDVLPWKREKPFYLIAQNLFEILFRCLGKVGLTSHHLVGGKTDIDRISASVEVREKGTNGFAQGMPARTSISILHNLSNLGIHHGNP
jgi:hypothetical protein